MALRTKIANKEMPGLTSQAELFSDPMSHPAPPLEALNTYLHYAVIYGRSPVGLPMPGLLKNAKKEAWDEKFNRTLQEIAWETATNYPYSGVTAAKESKSGGTSSGEVAGMKALIVGGGIGGLITALCLHEIGFEVRVFESVETIRPLGVGINLLPHAVRVLDKLGLLPRLDRGGRSRRRSSSTSTSSVS